jgi:NADH dehydrogenase/NADH:ubiquinone oxidoreductase subunit G
MSSISKIVNILSTKYGFDIKEATEHVKAEIQAYKNMTKEEKAAIKEAEKKAKAAAKAAVKEAVKAITKQEREAKKADKPKAPRTPAQEAALQKMIAANKAKSEAKSEAKAVQVQKPENNKYFVTFHNKTKQMDAEDIHFLGDYNVEFVETVEQITNTDIVPLCASNLPDYAKFVKKHADDIDDTEFDSVWYCYKQYEKPIQMSYTFVFHGEEYQVKFHQI